MACTAQVPLVATARAPGGRSVTCTPVPQQDLDVVRQTRQEGRGRGLRDRQHANLGPAIRAGPAKRVGNQLVAQAYAEDGKVALLHGFADQRLFGDKPGVDVFLEHVHRPAHDPDGIDPVEGRHRLALVQVDGRDTVASPREQRREQGKPLASLVLQHQKMHDDVLSVQAAF